MQTPQVKFDRAEIWRRGLVMLVFMVLFGIGQSLLQVLTVAQFLWYLVKYRPNERLTEFGRSLADWLAQVGRFQCCETEEKPFPWAAWPSRGGW